MHWPPTEDDLGRFFTQFWPALVATFLGVVFGVLGALWVERRRARKRNKEVAAEIAKSLRYNQIAVANLIKSLDKGAFSVTSPIEVAVFEMFRADIATLFPEPAMRGALARMYAEFARLATASDLHRDMSIRVAMDLTDPGPRILAGIRASLRTQAEAVLAGPHLQALLDAVIKLSGGAQPPDPEIVPMQVVVDTDNE
jgi:predicted outer membrane lipoprotein